MAASKKFFAVGQIVYYDIGTTGGFKVKALSPISVYARNITEAKSKAKREYEETSGFFDIKFNPKYKNASIAIAIKEAKR